MILENILIDRVSNSRLGLNVSEQTTGAIKNLRANLLRVGLIEPISKYSFRCLE
jgi:hypothetical protein